MKLYGQLQVQPAQRAVMAERWRSWCRRRRGLDMQLVAALENFQVHFCLLNAKLRSLLDARGARPNTPPCGAHAWPLNHEKSLERCHIFFQGVLFFVACIHLYVNRCLLLSQISNA
jgi:hypothetical protein